MDTVSSSTESGSCCHERLKSKSRHTIDTDPVSLYGLFCCRRQLQHAREGQGSSFGHHCGSDVHLREGDEYVTPLWDISSISFELRMKPFVASAWKNASDWNWTVTCTSENPSGNPTARLWFCDARGSAISEEKAKEAALAVLATALFIEAQNK